ncbi:hypothetical protein JTE90_021019 [Oedothorax gibbosus]|uniref:Uncharacterized protein n=1 Tax=Oedothorax gibbosus TaxID=931172 RepID=A0AAV6TFC4_9ARAC|nr:hypothetical protein JTE90_021019 [Oedothorax gibbosus]
MEASVPQGWSSEVSLLFNFYHRTHAPAVSGDYAPPVLCIRGLKILKIPGRTPINILGGPLRRGLTLSTLNVILIPQRRRAYVLSPVSVLPLKIRKRSFAQGHFPKHLLIRGPSSPLFLRNDEAYKKPRR